jgi:hypothetical protein
VGARSEVSCRVLLGKPKQWPPDPPNREHLLPTEQCTPECEKEGQAGQDVMSEGPGLLWTASERDEVQKWYISAAASIE